MILEHLWSYEDTPQEEAVRTHIKGLRHKLKSVGAPNDLIETVYGMGYRLRTAVRGTKEAREGAGEQPEIPACQITAGANISCNSRNLAAI